MGRLFADNVRLYVYSMNSETFRRRLSKGGLKAEEFCRCDAAVVTIREAQPDDFERVYPLLVEFENPYLKTKHWRQLFLDHTGLQNGHFGWVLVDGDDIVGFVGTILSERTIRGEVVRLCNTSSWIVKPAYRAHSLALHAKVIADKSVTVTNLSPTAQVLKLLEKLGFTLMDKSERIILPVVTPRTFMDRCGSSPGRALSGHSHRRELAFFGTISCRSIGHILLRTAVGDCCAMMDRAWPLAAAGVFPSRGSPHQRSPSSSCVT
jgi:hypothetical protein